MTSLKKAHIKLLFDISSPWSNIAFNILFRYKDAWNLEIDCVPIFLGGIMVGTKNTPPSALKAPLPYLLLDQRRVSNRFGVDTRSPPGHPLQTSSLNQIRFLRALKKEVSDKDFVECVRLVYLEFYSIQTLYTSPEFWHCLVPVLGLENLQRIMQLSQSDENKEGVKADVQGAINEYGMYGAPWIVATRPTDGKRDVFFGADKIESVGWWLGPEYIWKGPYPDGQDSVPICQIIAEPRL